MKSKSRLYMLLDNKKVIFAFSFLAAVAIWLMVVINVSPETTRVIKDVKVTIDTTVPSQFGLEVFGNENYTVDVTVSGKKYLISSPSLEADDISVVAQTNNVDSAGVRTLTLKAEAANGRNDYTIKSTSVKTIDVYFDTPKTLQMVIEPSVKAPADKIVADGYSAGEVNLSETSVTVSGPATEVNSIVKVVAELTLTSPLASNKSADAKLKLLDDSGKGNFKYTTLSIDSVVLTIPVLHTKELKTTVTFKNAPDLYVTTPLTYTVSPSTEFFDISVDEYESTTEYPIGVVDFRNLSPSNHVFYFSAEDTAIAESGETEEFFVDVNTDALSQDYYTIDVGAITLTNPTAKKYNVSGLNKSVVVVGSEKALAALTDSDIHVQVDLTDVEIAPGQMETVPATVTVDVATGCWVYGTYTVDVSL